MIEEKQTGERYEESSNGDKRSGNALIEPIMLLSTLGLIPLQEGQA
jgi:hypothetical protein